MPHKARQPRLAFVAPLGGLTALWGYYVASDGALRMLALG